MITLNLLQSEALLEGFSITAALIMAIGAQNAFVLKQGLRKRHVFLTASLCIFLDGILITLGVLGVGLALENHPTAITIMRWGGALFMLCYATKLFYNAYTLKSGLNCHSNTANDPQNASYKATIIAVLAFTLLNPHTYIDTLILIGSVGGQYDEAERAPFIIGALMASSCWFYGLSFGSRYLAPLFERPITWKILDIVMGCVMLTIGYSLVF